MDKKVSPITEFTIRVNSNSAIERATYDRFRLEQPHINAEGLYYFNQHYYIYCPDVTEETKAMNGDSIYQYLRDYRMIGSRIEVTNQLPIASAKRLPERTQKEILDLTGAFRNDFNFRNDLHLELQRILLNYKINYNSSVIHVYTTDNLAIVESKNKLVKAVERLQMDYSYTFTQQESIEEIVDDKNEREGFFGDIVISRFNSYKFTSSVKNAWESDEEFWLDNREKLFLSKKNNKESFRASAWNASESKCFLNVTTGGYNYNIRNLLTLYDKTIISCPLESYYNEFLFNLKITEDELIKLIELKRVQLLFPQSLTKYPSGIIDKAVEISNDAVMLSRRLAVITMADMRLRNPFLFPTDSIKEQQEIYAVLLKQLSLIENTVERNMAQKLLTHVITSAFIMPDIIHKMGAMGTRMFGLGRTIADMLGMENTTGLLLFDTAAQSVEWGAALDATIIPTRLGDVPTDEFVQCLANVYSGVPNPNWVPPQFDYANLAIEKILAVDSDIPVAEFAQTFKSTDINKFRKVMFDVVRNQGSPKDLEDAIKTFNHYINSYEQSSNNLQAWDLKGFLLEFANIPLLGWIVGRLRLVSEKAAKRNKSFSNYLDEIDAFATGTIPSAVLVSRMRNDLKETWKKSKFG